jgi:predicted nucleotidyltransferase
MNNLKTILSSFHLKDELNPKFWETNKNGDDIKMNSKIRTRLIDIANEFINYLDVDIIVSDVIMTGSLANYNWSQFSDIDLHIVVDFEQFSKEELPLYEELFKLKKTIYNNKHKITIYGYEVEFYVQNESESHFSSGVYSILFDEWIVKPKKEDVEIDTNLIRNKAQEWMNIIDNVIEHSKNEPLDDVKGIIKKYKDKIKKYRTRGLEKDGEYSDENLVFKVLRRNGYIEKLFNFEDQYTDEKLTLKERNSN